MGVQIPPGVPDKRKLLKEHHTKTKGDFAVIKVMLDLAERGYLILNPMTEHAPFDLVAYMNGLFVRIQVKHIKSRKNTITVKFTQSWADRNGTHTTLVNKDDVDFYGVYCPCNDEVYWIDPKKFSKTVSIRIVERQFGDLKTMHFSTDFKNLP